MDTSEYLKREKNIKNKKRNIENYVGNRCKQ